MALMILRTSVVADATGSQVVALEKLEGIPEIHLLLVTARDIDNAPTSTEFLLRRGVSEYLLEAVAQGTANLTASVAPDLRIPGGYEIAARFVGATTGDKLELCAFGYITPTEDQRTAPADAVD